MKKILCILLLIAVAIANSSMLPASSSLSKARSRALREIEQKSAFLKRKIEETK